MFIVYTNGDQDPDLISGLVPLMKKYGVQAYIDGHDHSMQYISFEGIEYMVQGTGSLSKDHLPKGKSDATDGVLFASLSSGFGAALVTADHADVTYVDSSGSKLFVRRLANPRNLTSNLRTPSPQISSDAASTSVYAFLDAGYLAMLVVGVLIVMLGLLRRWKTSSQQTHQYEDLP